MLSEKELTRLSKFLSLVLRHQPEVINLLLDEHGWASVEELLMKLKAKGFAVDYSVFREVVATNNKQRFAFNEDGTKIRANQGHSIPVDLQLKQAVPPSYLHHGTAEKNIPAIQQYGLVKQNRQHVHLSSEIETALKVGRRHGKPFVLHVSAEQMHKEGHRFYVSENGVWLTDHVPPKYILIVR